MNTEDELTDDEISKIANFRENVLVNNFGGSNFIHDPFISNRTFRASNNDYPAFRMNRDIMRKNFIEYTSLMDGNRSRNPEL